MGAGELPARTTERKSRNTPASKSMLASTLGRRNTWTSVSPKTLPLIFSTLVPGRMSARTRPVAILGFGLCEQSPRGDYAAHRLYVAGINNGFVARSVQAGANPGVFLEEF
jgi:hypothetical protein